MLAEKRKSGDQVIALDTQHRQRCERNIELDEVSCTPRTLENFCVGDGMNSQRCLGSERSEVRNGIWKAIETIDKHG